jgi:hypothetical protein
MINDQDHYEAYYADKLWNLLPAVYRAQDTDQFNSNGPLRELVNRIGAQAAVLRRSLDRMWEDQSIESCDDWVIPYIGDLLATNLVANLDARGQRLDVAKTIYYRRRKGTLAILEEIATDITGWEAKVVEFFRRLGRTRHGLDPAIGLATSRNPDVAQLQFAEGLVGPLTRTGIGGLADLRNVYGATKARSAFDEFFHTADFRFGRGQVGWYNIPRLGVFLWRLQSFGTGPTTPVPVDGCPGLYTVDPTGRDVPLFAAPRTADAYGSNWVSPVEAQLPTPISQPLFDAQLPVPSSPPFGVVPTPAFQLYPDSLAVFSTPTPETNAEALPVAHLAVRPPRGRVYVALSPAAPVWVTYHYGFSSEIGAGPYDRRLGRSAPPTPDPQAKRSGGGEKALVGAGAGAVPQSGTVTLTDSLTYTAADDVNGVQGQLTVRAGEQQRPVLRLPPTPGAWTFTGAAGTTGNCLVLDGLFLSGADLVLKGEFECVTLTCCTLDPGSAAVLFPPPGTSPPSSLFAVAADGRELVPSRLWIEGRVGTLILERSITGPIRTRGSGEVETLTINDSIIQAIPTGGAWSIPAGGGSDWSGPDYSFPQEFADAALALADGDVDLSRCTVLGRAVVHRLQASECILQDLVQVDDTQHGCVRFSAWADGSILPRQYESVRIRQGASLFTSADFGQPGYGQLLPTADAAILPQTGVNPAAPPTITAGAQDGSEMGAFARERNPIKERGLLLKYKEFMPAGLVPVIIYVT